MYNFDTKVILHHDGRNEWFAPTEIKSICKIDITFFPFDEQTCFLTFGSWTYNSQHLDLALKNNTADLQKYTRNGQWTLVSVNATKNTVKYSCCQHPFVDVTFTVHIRRRPLFYVQNLILPCILLATLSVFSFSLPPGSGERIASGHNVTSWTYRLYVDFYREHSSNIRGHTFDKQILHRHFV